MAIALPASVLWGIRVTQAIFAIIVLGTCAYVASWWRNSWYASSPSEIDFLIFSAVWTLLALAYLTFAPIHFGGRAASHHFAILAVEAITMIFWFAGFIALAVWLTGRVCYGDVCNSAKAGNVFAAFEWLLFAITTAFAVLHTTGTRKTTPLGKSNHPVVVQEGV